MKLSTRMLLIVGFMASSLFGGLIATLIRPTQVQAAPLASFGPQVSLTALAVPNAGKTVTTVGSWVKVTDVGHFTANNAASLVEVTHQGRLMAQSCNGTAGFQCAAFVIRVDNAGTMANTGFAYIQNTEVNTNVPITFTGYFQNLAAGDHVVSIWAELLSGSTAMVITNPGGVSGNDVIVKEYLPLGFTYLPQIER